MDALGALKVASAQLQLDAITGGFDGHGEDNNVSRDIGSEWDDWQGMGMQTSRESPQAGHSATPPAEANRCAAPCQNSMEHEDPTAALLSGVLFQQLSESRGGTTLTSENMAATMKNVLIATGIAVDDADIDAPLDYVEEMFAELGLGSSQGKRHRHLRGCTFESDAPRAPEEVCEGNESRSPPEVELVAQPQEDAHPRGESPEPQRGSPSNQPQDTTQNDPQHLVLQCPSHATPDAVARVPTAPGDAAHGGPDMPPAPVQADPQQHAPATAQANRNVQDSFSAQHIQQAHPIEQLSGQAEFRHPTSSVWDAPSGPGLHSGGMRTEALTQVAAAAAVAAAQAVKSDTNSELSQVLKAVLLQQNSLSMQRNSLADTVSAPTVARVRHSSAPYTAPRTTQHPPTPLQAPPSAVSVVRSISRVPEPFPAAHSSPTSLGASDLATGPRCDGDVDTNQTRPPPDERQTDTSRQRSMHCAVHTTQAPLNSGAVVQGREIGGIEKVTPAQKSDRAARAVPQRFKGRVSSTNTPAQGTRTSTPATRPTSPASQNPTEAVHPTAGRTHRSLAGGDMQQPANSDEPPLHPVFKASVDAARALVCPEMAAVRPTIELPQPDFAGKARSSLKRLLGDDLSYIDIKCAARAAASEAQTELMAFKRSMTTAASLVPTRTAPSWHSMEALEDVGLFADACVQEVALRAAQVQSDVSDGVYDLSHTRAQMFRSQAAARSLQQLSTKQTLALAQSDKDAGLGALISSEEQDTIQGTHGASRAGVRLGDRRQSASAGRKAGRGLAADEQAGARAPLKDGSNVKRGGTDSTALRAQAAYERAVDRGRARPSIAFGRRLEDASQGEARGDAKENGLHAAGPSMDAAVPAGASGKSGKATSRPNSGRVHRLPDSGQEARESNRQDARASPNSSLQRRDWHPHERSVPVSGETDEWDQRGGPPVGVGARSVYSRPPQHPGHIQSAHGASCMYPSSSAVSTDAALVALLQGLTEIIRTNSLAPPATELAAQPGWATQTGCQQPEAVPQQLPVLSINEELTAPQSQPVANGGAAPVCKAELCANTGHAGERAGHARTVTVLCTSASADACLEGPPGEMSVQSTAPTSPVRSKADRPTVATVAAIAKHLADRRSQGAVDPRAASATAAWAALGHRTPPKFLSVVDIAAPSTDQDFSSDCGRTSEGLGEFPHGVDVEALEHLIAASTCASVQGDGQVGPVQLTPEEASILKAVVKDSASAAAHSAASTGLRPSQGDASGVCAAAEGGWADERTCDVSHGEGADSVLTMKQSALAQSPHRGCGEDSASSNHQGSAGAGPLCLDVDAPPAVVVTESSQKATHTAGRVQSTPQEGGGRPSEVEHGVASDGGPPYVELDLAEASGCHGAAQQAPEVGHERHADSISQAINANAADFEAAAPASGDGAHEGTPPCNGHAGPEREGVEHCSIAYSVPSEDLSSSREAQPVGASRQPNLQERIKERYAELRQQTKACLGDSSTCDNSPERPQQPRAPPLPHRSDSPDTPTDLSIASLTFDASRAYPMRSIARHPPLATSVEHSVCSSHVGSSRLSRGVEAACGGAVSEADPSGTLITTDGPYTVPTCDAGARSQHSEERTVPATSARHRSSDHVSEISCFPPVRLSSDDSRADSKRDTFVAHGMDGAPAASCHSSAAVEKSGSAEPSAIQGLLEPPGVQQDWKISSARPGLEQYADLRCRLWRPPDDEQVFAAAADFGKASDVSGYCSEDSKYLSSSCADPPEHLPLALDRSMLRQRRLDRLKRRLKQESSFATTTSLASSSDITASDSMR